MGRDFLVGSACPMREPVEGEESWQVRSADHRDIQRFESAVGKRLINLDVQEDARFHLEAPIEPDAARAGVWVPVQFFVSFETAGVDGEGWDE